MHFVKIIFIFFKATEQCCMKYLKSYLSSSKDIMLKYYFGKSESHLYV